MAIEFHDYQRELDATRRVLDAVTPLLKMNGFQVLASGPMTGGGYIKITPRPDRLVTVASMLKDSGAFLCGHICPAKDVITLKFEVKR